MIKGNKTTFNERVDIVQYCIAHDDNYAKTSENHIDYYNDKRLQRNLGVLTLMEKQERYLQAA